MPKNVVATSRDVSKTVKLSAGTAERLNRVCERLDLSINSYLVHAISRAIVVDEGKIAQADMPANLTAEITSMFQGLIETMNPQDEDKGDNQK